MGERLGPTDITSPEYWGGHGLQDGCSWRQPPSDNLPHFFQQLRIDSFSERAIRGFLQGEKRPVRNLDQGEEFDPNAYPQGTIIHYEDEVLALSIKWPSDAQRYGVIPCWGVVVDFDDKGERKHMLMTYSDNSQRTSASLVKLGYPQKFDIKVGEPVHLRFQRNSARVEQLHRITNATLHARGEGVKESSKKITSVQVSLS